MAKLNSKSIKALAAAATAQGIGATELTAPAPSTPAKVMQVKQGVALRGARAAWYAELCKYNGKPVAEFVAAVTAVRPSLYGARSKHMGKPEPVSGWVSYFKRTGVLSLV